MRIDAHQHFWRYDPVEYRLDRRLDGGAEAGFLSRGPEARDVAVWRRSNHRGPGTADIGGDALASRSRERSSIHCGRHRLGRSPVAGGGRGAGGGLGAPETPGCPACSAVGGARISIVRGVSPWARAARAVRPDVRRPGVRPTAAGGRRPRSRVSQTSDSCSTTSGNRTSRVAAIRPGGRTSRSWLPFRTSGASCQVWSPKQTGERGRRSSFGHTLRRRLSVSARNG